MTPWRGPIHKAEQRERESRLPGRFCPETTSHSSGVGESSPTRTKGRRKDLVSEEPGARV